MSELAEGPETSVIGARRSRTAVRGDDIADDDSTDTCARKHSLVYLR
jgi:hypothetical protein